MDPKIIMALIIIGMVLVGIAAYLIINEKKKIIEWLKYAVVEAEKALGNGTGQLKLRKVYDWFCTKFPIVSTILPFEVFSAWVDVALETLDKWLESNADVLGYVGFTGKKHKIVDDVKTTIG